MQASSEIATKNLKNNILLFDKLIIVSYSTKNIPDDSKYHETLVAYKHLIYIYIYIYIYLTPGIRQCDVVLLMSFSVYDYQRNRCARNAEMPGLWEIQFNIESMW